MDDRGFLDVSDAYSRHVDRHAQFQRSVMSHLTQLTHFTFFLSLGVHSIEMSTQEDMLLILFNMAISNLVSRCSINWGKGY